MSFINYIYVFSKSKTDKQASKQTNFIAMSNEFGRTYTEMVGVHPICWPTKRSQNEKYFDFLKRESS